MSVVRRFRPRWRGWWRYRDVFGDDGARAATMLHYVPLRVALSSTRTGHQAGRRLRIHSIANGPLYEVRVRTAIEPRRIRVRMPR